MYHHTVHLLTPPTLNTTHLTHVTPVFTHSTGRLELFWKHTASPVDSFTVKSDAQPMATFTCPARRDQRQSLCVKEAARRGVGSHDSFHGHPPQRNTDVPSIASFKCVCGNTQVHLTRWTWALSFPQQKQETEEHLHAWILLLRTDQDLSPCVH